MLRPEDPLRALNLAPSQLLPGSPVQVMILGSGARRTCKLRSRAPSPFGTLIIIAPVPGVPGNAQTREERIEPSGPTPRPLMRLSIEQC
jgi:hypothetical protein